MVSFRSHTVRATRPVRGLPSATWLEPWPVNMMVSWQDRALLQRRAWLHRTDPEGMVSRDLRGVVHDENDVLRRRLVRISEIAQGSE